MVVDVHTHLQLREHFSPNFEDELRASGWKTDSFHCPPEVHWPAMAPVDKAFVVAFAAGASGMNVPNDFVAHYVAQHPEKLIGFMSVDPHDPSSPEEMERCYHDLGMRGLKLGPVYQNFHPLDPRAMDIYRRAERMGLPIFIHMATTFPRLAPLRYADPLFLDDIALAFPDLKIIAAHLGHPWCEATIAVIRKQPNVFSCISGIFLRPFWFYSAMITALEYSVTHKLLFASDFPLLTPAATMDGLRNMDRIVEGTRLPRFPPDIIEEIISRDSPSLLGLA